MKPPVRNAALDSLARRVVDQGAAPAAVATVGWRKHGRWHLALGAAGVRSSERTEAATAASVFDLASLTKPFVAVTVAREAARRGIALSVPVGDIHPTLTHTSLGSRSLESLLAHRAGLLPHLRLFDDHQARRVFCREAGLRAAASALRSGLLPSAALQDYPAVYSDLGYLIAGAVLERLCDKPLDALVQEHVAGPLGLAAGSVRWWLSHGASVTRFVPTENVPWRGGELVAQTHDENAWQWAGHGLAGHAGLFGTAAAVCRFGIAAVETRAGRCESWLPAGVLEPLLRRRDDSSLRAGFDGKAAEGSSAGALCGPETFGHLGFTGTSFWCDPEAEIVMVLLTNRVNPSREGSHLGTIRPLVHDQLFTHARAAQQG